MLGVDIYGLDIQVEQFYRILLIEYILELIERQPFDLVRVGPQLCDRDIQSRRRRPDLGFQEFENILLDPVLHFEGIHVVHTEHFEETLAVRNPEHDLPFQSGREGEFRKTVQDIEIVNEERDLIRCRSIYEIDACVKRRPSAVPRSDNG